MRRDDILIDMKPDLLHDGEIVFYTGTRTKNEPSECQGGIEFLCEKVNNEADEVAGIIKNIRNKCGAIDALFESVIADFGIIELVHFDDNGKELAMKLKERFQKIHSDYYWKVHESESEGDDDGWMSESLMFLTNLLANSEHQTLVIPQFRRTYLDICKNDDLTEQQKNNEFNAWLDYTRRTFGLSEEFK